jgi:hypothetical protein
MELEMALGLPFDAENGEIAKKIAQLKLAERVGVFDAVC